MTAQRRGRPAVIDRDAVVVGAMRILERRGVEGLTMKGLAAELAVTPMAAYRHISSKQALLELVVEEVLSRGVIPTDGPWQGRLWGLMWSSFQEVARYPGLADHLYHGAITASGRRMVEAGVALLLEAGMSDEEARLAYSDVYAYMMGRLVLRARAFEVGATARPRTERALPSLAELASDEHVQHGYNALVAGLGAK